MRVRAKRHLKRRLKLRKRWLATPRRTRRTQRRP